MWYLLSSCSDFPEVLARDEFFWVLLFGAIGLFCCSAILFIGWRFLLARKRASFMRGSIGLLFLSFMLFFVVAVLYLVGDGIIVFALAISKVVKRTSREESVTGELTSKEKKYRTASYALMIVVAAALPLLGYYLSSTG
jgi:hypothetical protein